MPSPCTVTGTLQTITDAALQGNAFVRFRLRNFSGFVPRIVGTSILAEPQIDVLPNGSGVISTSLWGNDSIDPINTFYTVEWWDGGRIAFSGNFNITGTNYDLNSAPQINPPNPPSTSIYPLTLETNGVKNGSQILLNLHSSDASVTLTDDGVGDIDLKASSGSVDTVQSISTNTTLVIAAKTNYLIRAAGGVAGITTTLPTAVGISGQKVTIKKVDSAAGTVTVATTGGQTIDGTLYGTSYFLTNFMQFVVLESDNANWNIVGGN